MLYRKITNSERLGQYQGIVIQKDGSDVLELRVSLAALLDESCGLSKIDIHEWLYQVAKSIIDEVNEFIVMEINSADINDKKIVGSWKGREFNKLKR